MPPHVASSRPPVCSVHNELVSELVDLKRRHKQHLTELEERHLVDIERLIIYVEGALQSGQPLSQPQPLFSCSSWCKSGLGDGIVLAQAGQLNGGRHSVNSCCSSDIGNGNGNCNGNCNGKALQVEAAQMPEPVKAVQSLEPAFKGPLPVQECAYPSGDGDHPPWSSQASWIPEEAVQILGEECKAVEKELQERKKLAKAKSVILPKLETWRRTAKSDSSFKGKEEEEEEEQEEEEQEDFSNMGPITWAYKNFQAVVRSAAFECVFGLVILVNAFVMAMQLQYVGISYGYALGMRGYDKPATESWPGAQTTFDILDMTFTTLFAIELLCRIIAERCRWLCSGWNYLDGIVLSMALAAWVMPSLLTLNPTVVRLIRFGKLLRLVRVMRNSTVLDSLSLLILSITSSVSTLFWSLCVLSIIQIIAAMLLSQLVESFLGDTEQLLEVRQEVFRYYGTYWRSMVTMYEITFANWAPPCRLLLDEVSEYFGIFFVLYRCAIGFAVLSVIQAVFIQQTMKTAQDDDEFQIQQRTREKQRYTAKLGRIFAALDSDNDGTVTWEEFQPLLEKQQMRMMMSTLDLDVDDLIELFRMLDDGDGRLTPDEFVSGVHALKGLAKGIDLISVRTTVRRIERRLEATLGETFKNAPTTGPSRRVSRKSVRRPTWPTTSLRPSLTAPAVAAETEQYAL